MSHPMLSETLDDEPAAVLAAPEPPKTWLKLDSETWPEHRARLQAMLSTGMSRNCRSDADATD